MGSGQEFAFQISSHGQYAVIDDCKVFDLYSSPRSYSEFGLWIRQLKRKAWPKQSPEKTSLNFLQETGMTDVEIRITKRIWCMAVLKVKGGQLNGLKEPVPVNGQEAQSRLSVRLSKVYD